MAITTSTRRRAAGAAVIGLGLLLAATVLPSFTHGAAANSTPPVVVSLTWDDGRASQLESVPIQQQHGMPATYYVNTALIGESGYYLTKGQLDTIAAVPGNEIGGHTLRHENLTRITLDQARATVCDDRTQLASWYGPTATRSFAYPYGATNADVKQIVKECGYTSARGVTGVMTPTTCLSCRPSESLPPLDPYLMVSPTSVGPTTTLADLEFQVQQAAANGGGWVIYTMHSIGVAGDSLNIDPALYSQFLDWLATRPDVQVRTVGDVMSETWPQPTTSTTTPPPPPTVTPVTIPNAGLEADTNNDGLSDCWQRGSSGTNTASWRRIADAHTGTAAEEVTITGFTSGDRKLVSRLDVGTANGGCAPSVDTAHSYRMSAWYRSTSQTRFVVFLRDTAGGWRYWRTGPKLPASADWVEATYDAGVFPAGTTAVSFGLLLSSVGTLATDDYSLAATGASVPALADASVRNSSLESDLDNNGVPDCWTLGGYGSNTFTYRRVTDAHTGLWGESLFISSLTSGDRKIVPNLDAGTANGGCAPAATPGTRYRLSTWYHSDTTVQVVAYYRDQSGAWRWWVSGTVGGNAASWTQASYITPPAPAGTTAISFGFGLANAGSIVTDDYSMTPVP